MNYDYCFGKITENRKPSWLKKKTPPTPSTTSTASATRSSGSTRLALSASSGNRRGLRGYFGKKSVDFIYRGSGRNELEDPRASVSRQRTDCLESNVSQR